ncbi:MAG: ABC transporter ATP-binding protein [Oscillospiraceae bacterium]|nr:ABC transporter ATP-binding protein [Oscillospiraceae bacterium]
MKFEVRSGSFGYLKGPLILSGVSFSIENPCILSVLGANGAGKTTLLKCMLGLLPWREGSSFLDGQEIGKLRRREFWRRVGYVPQARALPFSYTVREMAVLGRSTHIGALSQPGERDWALADEALAAVGISHLSGKLCSELSGGEYQLTLIARALAGEPELMVLDEPESNLDFKNQSLVLGVLKGLCHEKGLSVVLNTHYPEHALDISQKSLLMLPDGSAVFGGTPEVLTEGNLQKAFGIPVYIRQVELPGYSHACIIAGQASVQ